MIIDIDALGIKGSCKILHIGAHEAEELESYVEQGWTDVVWVEPIPEKHEIVLSRIQPYENMKAFNYAAWTKSGLTFSFYQTNNGQSSSIYPLNKHSEVYPHIIVEKIISVNTISIDDLMEEINWQPDMINLDIQGAEYDALLGGLKTLKKTKYIYTEVSYDDLYFGACLEPQLTRLLKKNGFDKRIEEKAMDSWGDAFYVKI